MTRKKALPTTLIGFLVIVAILSVLAFVPDLLQRRKYNYTPSSESKPSLKDFPLSTRLPLVGEKRDAAIGDFKNPHGIIINFWATWCPPCLEELPALEYLGRQLSAKNSLMPTLVTISVDESADDVVRLFKTLDFTPTLTVLHDKAGEFTKRIGTTKFPETYWISAEGKVLHKWIGPQNWLAEDVVKRLAEPPK